MTKDFKLDQTDRKILYELELDSRQPSSRIAKRLRISKQTLGYRINRLVREGVISGFITALDMSRLGYYLYMVWIELSGVSLAKKKDFIDYLVRHKQVHWVASCGGKYDAAVLIASENSTDFNNTFKEIQRRFPGYIQNYIINMDYEYHRYQRIYGIRQNEPRRELFSAGQSSRIKLDEADMELLKELSRDSRTGTKELAEKAGISENTVRARIRRMEGEGLIKAYTISIHEHRMGLIRRDILVSLHNQTVQREKDFEAFCLRSKPVIYLLRMIGKYDAYLTLIFTSDEEKHGFLNEMRSSFSDMIRDFEITDIIQDHKFDYLPMHRD